MIPAFTKDGYLPPGIHLADIHEFEQRFAYTIKRRKFFGNLQRLMTDLKTISCTSIYVDGSFTTTKRVPGDIDICWEDSGINYLFAENVMPILFDFDNGRENQQKEYNADIFPAHFIESGSGVLFIDFFQKVKYTDIPKGIIQLIIY
jgi:hypothetical protein